MLVEYQIDDMSEPRRCRPSRAAASVERVPEARNSTAWMVQRAQREDHHEAKEHFAHPVHQNQNGQTDAQSGPAHPDVQAREHEAVDRVRSRQDNHIQLAP